MTANRPSVAYLTAGAGGMLCGSCIHDNTLARALIRRGIDAHLIPTYTPIRTDEENVSDSQVFLGGVNVFLSQIVPGYRYLPEVLTRWLDKPWLIQWATQRASATSAAALGALTISMLRGTAGFQRREVEQLCQWLVREAKPDLIVLSNILIAGCVPRIKDVLNVPVLVTLQGDDIFLDSLPQPYRSQAFTAIRPIVAEMDGFLVNSNYYAEFMQQYLSVPAGKLHVIPLGIDVSEFTRTEQASELSNSDGHHHSATIGYLARLAPEKGLHVLVDAFLELRRRGNHPDARLHVAGWLGESHRQYAQEQREKLKAAGLEKDVQWRGEVDRRGKVEFLRGLDVFSVPTTYREPKGLYVLESLAAGVPVVQPAHGAFPELLAATGGGQLVPPGDPLQLADGLELLLGDATLRQKLGREGQHAVFSRFHADAMAAAAWDVMKQFIPSP